VSLQVSVRVTLVLLVVEAPPLIVIVPVGGVVSYLNVKRVIGEDLFPALSSVLTLR
jgi:hypothetical protein